MASCRHISLTLPLYTFFLLLLPSVNSINFRIANFQSNTSDIFYQGDAIPSNGSVEFNRVNFPSRVGWVMYTKKMRMWDSATGKVSDFSTHFTFIIDTQGSHTYGHGLVFFLGPAGAEIPPNSAGGFLGLFNTTTCYSLSNQIVTVEFDSFPDSPWDPPVEHIGINNNSVVSSVYAPWNASLHSGEKADVLITYNATTKNLSVTWSSQTVSASQANGSLSYQIDLKMVLPEWVMVGFSAATGEEVERHVLDLWEFSSSLDTNENYDRDLDDVSITLVASLPISGVAFLGIIAISALFWRRRKHRSHGTEAVNLASIYDDLESGVGPRRFSYKYLALATNNFSDERKLGEGGFGAVYKGHLTGTSMNVAVKKISRGSKQGIREYITEVKIISRVRHRNLVQLIGWCHDRGEFLLVYEFMPNGSLDSHLFGKMNRLPWPARYKISQGLASALLYLHEEWEQCVVHRDIKSSNVMLDSDFNVKLGDFGLARLMDHEINSQTTGLAGTFGYMAPEYISTGRASKESDVFSYGVVALEIATGRKSNDPLEMDSQMGLVEWVWDLYGRGELLQAVDESLQMEGFDERQVVYLMVVGLWCAHPDRSRRPSIRQVIQVLSFDAALPNLPPKMPVPTFYATSRQLGPVNSLTLDRDSSSTGKGNFSS